MKIVRVLTSGRVVLCSDTSRVNRGEVYWLSKEYQYSVMPCVYFHLNGNSRRVLSSNTEKLIDKFGFAYHLENTTLACDGAEDARIFSMDHSIVAGQPVLFSQNDWHKIWGYTLDFNTPMSQIEIAQLDLGVVLEALANVTKWLTLNAGDWFLYGLLPSPCVLTFPTRLRLFANEELVLDELLRS